MTPRILEYEEGMIVITPEAMMIPETRSIIEKHGKDYCMSYLGYVYMHSYPDSPYRNMDEREKEEQIIADIKESMGDFDETDELIKPAIEKLRSLWTSPQVLSADEMEQELHRWRTYLRDTPMGGDMRDRLIIVDKFEKTAQAAANMRKIADDEIGHKMKGSNELGEY